MLYRDVHIPYIHMKLGRFGLIANEATRHHILKDVKMELAIIVNRTSYTS